MKKSVTRLMVWLSGSHRTLQAVDEMTLCTQHTASHAMTSDSFKVPQSVNRTFSRCLYSDRHALAD